MHKITSFVAALSLSLVLCNFSCEVPETYVYLGHQVPKSFVKEIRELGLLEKGEKIKYFYTDGFSDIKDGMYFVTETRLVVYNQEWDEPKTIIPFEEITYLDIEYNESFLVDSMVLLETDEFELNFPISSELKRDKAFFEYLLEKSREAQGYPME